MRVFLRVYPIVFVLLACLGGPIQAQDLNPSKIEAKILQGTSFTHEFISNKELKIVTEDNIGAGNTETEVLTLNIDHLFTYHSAPDFVGDSRFIIERSEYLGDFRLYTEVNVRVVASLVEANKDVAFLPNTTNSVSIDVLTNDTPGFGNSSVVSVDLVENGAATIQGNSIRFLKRPDFEGITSFNYTIEDANGHQSTGTVVIYCQGQEALAGQTLHYTTSTLADLSLVVDDPTYALDQDATLEHGSIVPEGEYAFTFSPNPGRVGQESFNLINSEGEVISIVIDIIDDRVPTSIVVNDKYYTPEGQSITFNPRDNDYSQEGAILDYSRELTFDGTNFTYQPEEGYGGVKNFTYTIQNGQRSSVGKIDVYVGNYLPQRDNYNFEILEGNPFVLEYNVPIEGYTWKVVSNPVNGFLLLNNSTYVTPGCGVVSGNELIVYAPSTGYTGDDYFTIEYCVGSVCKTVDINVDIIPNSEACPCIGQDCVWSGDANNDGKVSVLDVLSIGDSYGETGAVRNNASNEWRANHAEDWAFNHEENQVNNKFADSDGNGTVDSRDMEALEDNLNEYHNINAQEVIAQKEIPLSFVVSPAGPYKAGDRINIEVFAGNETTPVVDLNGLAFSFKFPKNLVVKSSVTFEVNDAWMGLGSPVISANSFSNDGVLEIGLSRTGDIGVFGGGKIGTTGIILMEDLDGFDPNGDQDHFDILFEQAIISNGEGDQFKIEDKSLRLELANGDDLISTEPAVVVYPNPSADAMSFHANGGDELYDIQIFDTSGKLAFSQQDIYATTTLINPNLETGFYTAIVTSRLGVSVEKLQIIKE